MPSSPTPLDRLLDVLKSPALARELATRSNLWSEMKRLADIHRFLGLLAHSTSPYLPTGERPWRDHVLMAHHRRHTQRLQALRRVSDAFRNEGVRCVALKGPLLAERFYEHPFLRPSNDLDLLVHEREVGVAARLLQKLGFPLEGRYPWPLQRRVVQHLNFGPTDWSPRVELHYRWLAGGVLMDTGEFVDRSCSWRSPSGFECNLLSNADEAFYSCIHAANHGFHRLRWLYDLITIARTLTPRERPLVRQLAIRHGQTGHFVATAVAARELFGETPDLGCADLPVPWLRLTPRQARRMVERVEGNTATLSQKVGYRFDLFRMTGTPVQAALLLASATDCELRKRWYEFRNPRETDILARTLPG